MLHGLAEFSNTKYAIAIVFILGTVVLPVADIRAGSFRGCWRVYEPPNECEIKFLHNAESWNGQSTAECRDCLIFQAPRFIKTTFFLEFRRGPHWASLQLSLYKPFSWWGGGLLGNAAPPHEPCPLPALSPSCRRLYFSGLVLHSRLARPPITDRNDASGRYNETSSARTRRIHCRMTNYELLR